MAKLTTSGVVLDPDKISEESDDQLIKELGKVPE